MAKRETKRNGRGQIVSYEISKDVKDQSYGEVMLSNTNAQEFEKYNVTSFRANVDSDIVEFAENEEYQSQETQISIPLPGLFASSGPLTIETTTAALVDANPQVDLGYVALPIINPLVNSNGGNGGNGGS